MRDKKGHKVQGALVPRRDLNALHQAWKDFPDGIGTGDPGFSLAFQTMLNAVTDLVATPAELVAVRKAQAAKIGPAK